MATCCRWKKSDIIEAVNLDFLCKDPLVFPGWTHALKKGDQNWTVDAAGKILQLKKKSEVGRNFIPLKNPLVIYIYYIYVLDLHPIRWQKSQLPGINWPAPFRRRQCMLCFFFSVSFLHQAIGGADPRTLAVLRDCGDTKKGRCSVSTVSNFVIWR